MSYEHPSIPGLRVIDAKFFAQVESTGTTTRFDHGSSQSVPAIKGARVVSITQQRPAKAKAGCVVVELTLRIPEQVFLPIAPSAVIDLPASLAQVSQLVEVEVTDDNGAAVAAAWAAANKGQP